LLNTAIYLDKDKPPISKIHIYILYSSHTNPTAKLLSSQVHESVAVILDMDQFLKTFQNF